MLPPTRDFTRTGCTVGARLVTYQQLEKDYVCNACGGAIVHRMARKDDQTVDWAECGSCKARDFVSARRYELQAKEYPLVVVELPAHLRALFRPQQPMTADQAIADLYG